MKVPVRHIKGIVTAAIISSVLAPGVARANQIFTFVDASADSQIVNITPDGGVSFISGFSGRYQGKFGSGPNIHVFCVDLFHDVSNGDVYNAKTDWRITDPAGAKVGPYYSGGLSSALNPLDYHPTVGGPTAQQRANEVGFLASTFLEATAGTFAGGASGSTSLLNNFTAISLSIWDINQDGGDGISAGLTQTDGAGQAAFGSMVAYYESLAALHQNSFSPTAWWIQAPRDGGDNHFQDFVYIHDAVPEPGAPVVIVGMALAFMLTRRLRSRNTKQSTRTDIVPAS